MPPATTNKLDGILSHQSTSKGICKALNHSPGAQFYRCALQVNPFDYLSRHSKTTLFKTEEAYNDAMIEACKANGIDLIAITDHFRVATAISLAEAARQAGIAVFYGFEANSSDGVHLLCIFDENISVEEVNLIIGACGVTGFNTESPCADKDCVALLSLVKERGGVTIAAHACSASGILKTLSGSSRTRAWKTRHLMAVALPGPRDDAPVDYRKILKNQDAAHKRERPVAVVNASDISDPSDFSRKETTTLIKMTEASIEGLRQAFLDYESRIRLNYDEPPAEHVEIVAATWDGGLLDGQAIRFNSDLNVFVGGRGAGKSTVIESLRHVLGCSPKGVEAKRTYDSFVKNVLRSGTKISVLIRSPRPSPQHYLLECVVPNKTTMRSETGSLVQGLQPLDVMMGVECYGQHEISELTRSPEQLAHLLDRFVDRNPAQNAQKADIIHKLDVSRKSIDTSVSEVEKLRDDISSLPALREKLDRYDKAGLKSKLADKSLLDKELRVFNAAKKEVESLTNCIKSTIQRATINHASFSENELKDLPRVAILREADRLLLDLEATINVALAGISHAIDAAGPQLNQIQRKWREVTAPVEQQYSETLRELQRLGVDGADFISTQDLVAALLIKEDELARNQILLDQKVSDRQELVASWENIKAQELRALEKAAKKVGRNLDGRVRVRVRRGTSLSSLEAVLRSAVQGQGPAAAIERFREDTALSIPELAETVRNGAGQLAARYGLTAANSEKIAAGGENLAMRIEEVELPAEAVVELNVGREGEADNWKALDDLSTGQKATAVLLLLLLGSDAPLLIDQPEDDLDNRFITDVVVPTMRKEKSNRQFIFSTHNANIPVLGDAEQIIGLTPIVEDGVEKTIVQDHLVGSIDTTGVREIVRDLLEGGRVAFELRREKYGF